MSLVEQTFSVSGMHCAACSSRIERLVSQLDGVESAQVNLASEKMKCRFDDNQIALESIVDRVASIGFGLEEDNSFARDVTLTISGMHCASCSTRIENVLNGKEGTGLGLYVIRQIIEANHGGKVKFTSRYGKGSQITIELPFYSNETANSSASEKN